MNVAFIPVRGGSKSIPLKNIKEIHGKPLVYWVVAAASDCAAIDKVFVATDSDRIKKVVEKFCAKEPERFTRVTVLDRSEESAT
ncbi:MAG: acylneuraminate cytidylyltransferase, partial [Lachnospiraceae bacterium]|nr:acylneuraminate cytidylyltransferase [Lachnospiraceae bacterium]